MTTLHGRKGQILRFIVSDYVTTASPVASNTVARVSGLNVSPATVRNEMVALEEDGYILRPHISAGGIPAEKGYRYYVDSLDAQGLQITSADSAALEQILSQARADLEAWAESSAASLSVLLNTLSFSTPLRSPAASVKGVELLRLQESIIMLVLILREASIHRELITLAGPVTGPEVEHARNRLSEVMTGKTAQQIQAAVPEASDPIDQKVLESAAGALRRREAEAFGDRIFQGLARLLAQPELTARPEQARNVVGAIEDPDVFFALAGQAPAGTTQGAGHAPNVMIGSETGQETLREFSVVICRYGVPGEAEGLIGVVGPTRMAYDRAIPAVRQASESLTGFAMRVYGVS